MNFRFLQIITVLLIAFSGCKKVDDITSKDSSDSAVINQSSEGGGGGTECVTLTGEMVDVDLYNEQDLYDFLYATATTKNGYRLILHGNVDNEFFIRGEAVNSGGTLAMVMNYPATPNHQDNGVYKFSGWSNLEITSVNPSNPVKIIFSPIKTQDFRYASSTVNKRLFLFEGCQNVVLHDFEVYVNHLGNYKVNYPEISHDVHYWNSVIQFSYGNENVEVYNLFLKGLDPTTSYSGSGNIEDFWYMGALGSGLHYDVNGNDSIGSIIASGTPNLNFCIHDNIIKSFRVYGMYFMHTNNLHIENNEIEQIWEAASGFAAQAGGIEVKHASDVDILNNTIKSVYSLWPPGEDPIEKLHEQYQHGIYVSDGCNNLLIDNNDIRLISGACIHIHSEKAYSSNIVVSNNIAFWAMNWGLIVSYANNVEIYDNYFWHNAYKLNNNAPYYLWDNCNPSTRAAVELQKELTNVSFHHNNIKNTVAQMYSYDDFSWSVPHNKLWHRIIIVGSSSSSGTINADIANPLKCHSNTICINNYPAGHVDVPQDNTAMLRFFSGSVGVQYYEYSDISVQFPSFFSSFSLNCP